MAQEIKTYSNEDGSVSCPVCGLACKWLPAEVDDDPPGCFGGWYCARCDVFAETDVELED